VSRARGTSGPRPVRRLVALALAVTLCGVAAACTETPQDSARRPVKGSKGIIVVGVSGAFAENQLVAEMYAQVLQHAGYTVERQLNLRSREISQSALESGEIDVKPEYLSSLLLYVDPSAVASNDPENAAAELRKRLEPKGIEVLTPSPAQDTNRFVANARTAERFGLTTMSSLAPVASQLTLGAPPECPQRPFCLTGLHETYGILFDDFVPLDVGGPQTVAALNRDEVQIGLLFSTDPSIAANGFVPLVDDKHLQNAENITPVIRSDIAEAEVRSALDEVSGLLSTRVVTRLVGKVVLDGEDIPGVAEAFLTSHGAL
jgi:osmoprotectant transport system substrate-binding protein